MTISTLTQFDVTHQVLHNMNNYYHRIDAETMLNFVCITLEVKEQDVSRIKAIINGLIVAKLINYDKETKELWLECTCA